MYRSSPVLQLPVGCWFVFGRFLLFLTCLNFDLCSFRLLCFFRNQLPWQHNKLKCHCIDHLICVVSPCNYKCDSVFRHVWFHQPSTECERCCCSSSVRFFISSSSLLIFASAKEPGSWTPPGPGTIVREVRNSKWCWNNWVYFFTIISNICTVPDLSEVPKNGCCVGFRLTRIWIR